MSRNFHDDDEYEQEEQPTAHQIEEIYEGRPDVSEMSYEELEREIKYERAMVEAESARISTGRDWREASEIAIGQNGQIHKYNKVVERAEELGDNGRHVQDEISIRRQATEQELEPSYARQNEIYIELDRRDNLKTPSNELTKEAHQAIGELDERGKDAKTSTQELSKEAREATREMREKDRDRDEPER